MSKRCQEAEAEKKAKTNDFYVVIKFCPQEVSDTATYRIPSNKVDEKLLEALQLHHGEYCELDCQEAPFRKACKLISYKLEEFEDYRLSTNERINPSSDRIVDVFWISENPDA